jgi:hypothetical protein
VTFDHLRHEDGSCTGCDAHHVTVWLAMPFKRYCARCFEHHFGRPPEDPS